MLRTPKAKTHKGRKILEEREPKVEELPKQAIFIKGKRTGTLLNDVLKNLYQLKKPLGVIYKRHNDFKPFEDTNSLEFFSRKSNASLFAFGLHSKKRPNSLVIGRLFDGRVLDMTEWLIRDFKSMDEFKCSKKSVGSKPLIVFAGDAFEQRDDYGKLKNLILDFFHGQQVRELDLAGLDHVISVTAFNDTIYFRTYGLRLKKSGTRLPRVELEETGPNFNFTLGRVQFASADLWREATKVPRVLKPKKEKNMEHTPMGDKFGRIHMERQDFSKLQNRKMKGLRKRTQEEEGEEEDQEVSDSIKRPRSTKKLT